MESNKWCKVGEAKQSSQDKWQENAVCDLDFEGRSRKWTKKKKTHTTITLLNVPILQASGSQN